MDFSLEPILLAPLALVLALMLMPVLARWRHGPVIFILPRELAQRLDEGEDFVLLDLRPARDFAKYHIDGAVNISASAVRAKLTENGDRFAAHRQAQVAVICQSDLTSHKVARILHDQGFENVVVVRGGMSKWRRSRLPLVGPMAPKQP